MEHYKSEQGFSFIDFLLLKYGDRIFFFHKARCFKVSFQLCTFKYKCDNGRVPGFGPAFSFAGACYRCKTNRFFQLAVDAAALKLATVNLQHPQVFPYLADHARLWLLCYALCTALSPSAHLWFLAAGSVCRTAEPFSFPALFSRLRSAGRGSRPPAALQLAVLWVKSRDVPAGLLLGLRAGHQLCVTFTCGTLDGSSVEFLL